MGMLRHVTAIDVQDLVAFVQSRYAHVRRGIGRDSRYDDGHTLVRTALQTQENHGFILHRQNNHFICLLHTTRGQKTC